MEGMISEKQLQYDLFVVLYGSHCVSITVQTRSIWILNILATYKLTNFITARNEVTAR